MSNVVRKLNSKTYSLRLQNKILPRPLHLQVVHNHFYILITYGISLWGSNVSSIESRRLDTLIYRILRVHCFDFQRRIPNSELCRLTGCRSFKSLRVIYDACILRQICTETLSTHLTLRLIEQYYTWERVSNRIFFFDCSYKQTGRSSFVNRAKTISETIPFEWMSCSRHLFKFKMKTNVPLFIGWFTRNNRIAVMEKESLPLKNSLDYTVTAGFGPYVGFSPGWGKLVLTSGYHVDFISKTRFVNIALVPGQVLRLLT